MRYLKDVLHIVFRNQNKIATFLSSTLNIILISMSTVSLVVVHHSNAKSISTFLLMVEIFYKKVLVICDTQLSRLLLYSKLISFTTIHNIQQKLIALSMRCDQK